MADPYGYPRPTVVALVDNLNEMRRKVNQISDDLGDKRTLLINPGTSFEKDSDIAGVLIELDYRINQQDSDLYLRIDGGSLFLHNGKTNTTHGEFIYDSAAGSLQLNAPRGHFTIDALGDIILDADGNDIIFKNGAGGDTVTHTLANDGNFVIAAPANYTVDVVGDITLDAAGDNIFFKDAGTTRVTYTLGATTDISMLGSLTTNVDGSIADSAGTSISQTSGSTFAQTSGSTFTQTSGSNFTTNVTGEYLVDVSGDITLDADGNDIIFKNGAGADTVTHTLADDGNYTIAAPNNYTLDVTTDITLDADGNDIIFKNGSGGDQVTHTLANDANYTITAPNNYTVDAVTDIILDADGNDIIFKNGAGSDQVTHSLADDANYVITSPNNYTLDVSTDITLDADGGNWFFKDNAVTQFEFIAGTNKEIDVPSGDLTIDVAGDINLDADGGDVVILDGGVEDYRFATDGTVSRTGDLILDISGDITLDADGNDIIFKNGAGADTVTHTLADTGDYTITSPANYTVDTVGDITLDAAGDNIVFKDAGSTRVTYTLGATTDIALDGNLTTNVGGSIVDSAGTTYTRVAGTNISDTATTGTITQTSGTTFNQVSGGNFTTTVTGNVLVDASGDITLDADGNDIVFKNGAGGDTVTHTLADDANYTITAPNNYTVDAVTDIILDADGNDIIFKNGAGGDTVTHTLADNAVFTLTTPANYTVDAAGDITLDAAGDNIIFADAGSSRVIYTLGATTDIAVGGSLTTNIGGTMLDSSTGDMTFVTNANYAATSTGTFNQTSGGNFTTTVTGNVLVDASGDITLDADGNNIIFKNGAGADTVTHTLADDANYTIAAPGNYTVDASGDITLDADGNDIIFKNGAGADTVTHTLADDANYTIAAPGNYTVDAVGDIILDAAGTQIILKKEGTQFGEFITSSTPDHLYIKSSIQDNDIIFGGNDGGTPITALTLDMSDAGSAIFNHDAYFPDSGRVVFGADSDLQIYHTGSNSVIADTGTGNLIVRANDLRMTSYALEHNFLQANESGAVTLYHNNVARLATTVTGVDVTGVITTDGMTTSADVNFGDNDKAIFGADSDLLIYHDGLNSYITDNGTGDLIVTSPTAYRVRTDQFQINNAANTAELIQAVAGGAVNLRHNGLLKLATTATGIDVTGSVTADGFQTDTANTTTNLLARNSSNAAVYLQNGGTGDVLHVRSGNMAAGQGDLHLKVANNGDISFYNAAGNSQSLFWDASAESLGIGNAIPIAALDVTGTDAVGNLTSLSDTVTRAAAIIRGSTHANGYGLYMGYGNSSTDAQYIQATLKTGSAAFPLLLNPYGGNVGLGTTTPARKLEISGGHARLSDDYNLEWGGGANYIRGSNASNYVFVATNSIERMRIDESGNVGIGQAPTAFPNWKVLELKGGTAGAMLNFENSASTRVSTVAYDDASDALRIQNFLANPITFETDNIERARIDSDGTFFVGKTVSSLSTVGFETKLTGETQIVRDEATVLRLNRHSDSANDPAGDGTILDLRRFGQNIGVIGSYGGSGYIGTADTALAFYQNANAVIPFNAATVSERDAAIDLGSTDFRFKDLHVSGKVNTATADLLGTLKITNAKPEIQLFETDGTINQNINMSVTNGGFYVAELDDNATEGNKLFGALNGGDVNFYDDGGAAALLWDASTKRLGVNTLLPNAKLEVREDNVSITNPFVISNRDTTSGVNTQTVEMSFALSRNSGALKTRAGTIAVSREEDWDIDDANINSFMTFSTIRENVTTEAMRITSGGYVAIGTDSPTQPLNVLVPDNSGIQIESAAGHKGYLFFGDDVSNTVGRIGYDHDTDVMGLWAATTEVVAIDATGIDVTGSVTADGLTVNSGTANNVATFSSTDAYALIKFEDNTTAAEMTLGALADDMVFRVNATEAMRIDSSQNLLVGKTAANSGTVGIEARPTGRLFATADGAYAAKFERLSSSGTLIQLTQDGVPVGSIGVASSRVYIGTDDTGLRFTNDEITPFNPSVSADRNGTVDLGGSSTRFKDLHLLGGVYTGGDKFVYSYAGGVFGQVRSGIKLDGTNNQLEFYTGQNENMIIDASGNLLVGTTDTTIYNNSANNATDNGMVYSAVDSRLDVTRYTTNAVAAVASFNRTGNDGSILSFAKSGVSVGSIGVSGTNNTYISGSVANHSGLIFATNEILPTNAGGAGTNGFESLGSTSNRFKDLHLSGTAFLPNAHIDSAHIDGGVIDNTVIGDAVPSRGTFTNVTVTNQLSAPNISPTNTSVNDYALRTHQSVADSSGFGLNTVTFGTDSDLSIFHGNIGDGQDHSYISGKGTGNLILQSNNIIKMKASIAGGLDENMLVATPNAGVDLFHNGNKKLETNALGVAVTGLLTADTKSFTIDHPIKEGMKLRYGSLEGPEHGVYVRGRLSGTNTIVLPEVWTGLVDEDTITVNLTSIGKGECWIESIENNTVTVGGHLNCFYMVQAERKDVEKLIVEFPDVG